MDTDAENAGLLNPQNKHNTQKQHTIISVANYRLAQEQNEL